MVPEKKNTNAVIFAKTKICLSLVGFAVQALPIFPSTPDREKKLPVPFYKKIVQPTQYYSKVGAAGIALQNIETFLE